MLAVHKISKNFGDTMAVDHISFKIEKGDVVGLLGPNGAGKTTTMRMIASYYYPTSGEIEINQKNTKSKTQETQQNIGYLPENNPLYLDMLVYDYLAMTGKLYGISKKDIRNSVEKTAKSVGLESKLGKPINELSKGYKQRVGLAAAMIHDPSLLVLDEPTEGLDPNQREEIRKLIKQLSKNKAILISTHVMQEVKAMCTKVVVIDKGKLVVEGHPDTLTEKQELEIHIEGSNIKEQIKGILDKGDSLEVTGKNRQKVVITSKKHLQPEISKLAIKNNWIIWQMQTHDDIEEVFRSLA